MLCFYLLAPGSTPFDTKTGFACYQGLIQRHDWRISPSCGTSFLEPLVPPYNARGFCLFPQREGKHLVPAAGFQERQESSGAFYCVVGLWTFYEVIKNGDVILTWRSAGL